MERLTRVMKINNTKLVVYTKGKYEDATAAEMEYKDVRNVMRRLSEYEDTGLDPEQIQELKERDTAQLTVQYGDEDEPILRCPHCDEDVTDLMECGFDFCPYCGKRWYGR